MQTNQVRLKLLLCSIQPFVPVILVLVIFLFAKHEENYLKTLAIIYMTSNNRISLVKRSIRFSIPQEVDVFVRDGGFFVYEQLIKRGYRTIRRNRIPLTESINALFFTAG